MFGFRFEEDDEADAFLRCVRRRLAPQSKLSCQLTDGQALTNCVAAIPRSESLRELPKKRRSLSVRRGHIPPTSISPPAPDSFVHVAQVRLNKEGMIETSGDVDPSWKTLAQKLQGYVGSFRWYTRLAQPLLVRGGGAKML